MSNNDGGDQLTSKVHQCVNTVHTAKSNRFQSYTSVTTPALPMWVLLAASGCFLKSDCMFFCVSALCF